MPNVIVKKVRANNGDCYFHVIEKEKEGLIRCFYFDETVKDETRLVSEEYQRQAALDFAKKVESGQIVNGEEIIYQTPKNPNQ